MRSSRTASLVVVFVVGAAALGTLLDGCGGRGPASDPGVDLTDGTVFVPSASWEEALLGEDPATGEYRFRAGAAALDDLDAGDVFILAGKALRRVTSVEPGDDAVVVATVPAKLNEAVQDGTLAWEHRLDFTGETAALEGFGLRWGGVALAEDVSIDSESVSFSGTVRGFRVETKLTPSPGRLDVEMVIRKKGIAKRQAQSTMMDLFLPVVPLGENEIEESEEDVLRVSAKGWIGSFESTGSIEYADGQLQQFTLMNHDMTGNLELKFAAISGASTIRTGVEILRLPMQFDFPPVLVGGWLPVQLSVGATPRVTAAVTSPNASSRGAFEIEFSADQGFSFHSGIVEEMSQLHDAVLEIDPDSTQSAGQVTTAFSYGLEFPRFEVQVIGNVVVPFMTIDTYGESYYEPGMLSRRRACQRARIRNRSVAGVNLSFLGFEHTSEQELWDREIAEGSDCE